MRSSPPPERKGLPSRRTYGRNGRGRHAAFRFSDPYIVRTWRDGTELTYEVRRGSSAPFEIKLLKQVDGIAGHGTEVKATSPGGVTMTAEEARAVIGLRFLADPNFKVALDGATVTFDDIPAVRLREADVQVPPHGAAHITMIDTQRPDRTTRQHGIAWRVNSRLVGNPGWVGFNDERILDGRSTEAKRFQFIVEADFLSDAVLSDWSGFASDSEAWSKARPAVHDEIKALLSSSAGKERGEAKAAVKARLEHTVNRLPPVGRDRWNSFVDQVVDSCPSITTEEVAQVADILAKLELATSKYGLIARLHDLQPGDFDQLHEVLTDWNVRTAKIALDEIQSRLKLIQELDQKLRDANADEVRDLQPLFERSLWVFGPEFESLEFTSNKGMTEVIRKIFGAQGLGSRQRPDFVMLPDGSVGFYSRDLHDLGHEVDGVARLVIAEIKKPGVVIGSDQKNQAWKYVKELIAKGFVTSATTVTCYVLGSRVDPAEASDRTEFERRVTIMPMLYNVFIKRAEKRMLGLREKLSDAPFLREQGVDGRDFIEPRTTELDLRLPRLKAEPPSVVR